MTIDNLRFDYAPTAVPEPSMLGLLLSALGLLAWQRRSRIYSTRN
jgi:hypothetical protein